MATKFLLQNEERNLTLPYNLNFTAKVGRKDERMKGSGEVRGVGDWELGSWGVRGLEG